MRSHKFWYSALWLCSKALYKPNRYISFVSIFYHRKSKWKSLHWLNCSSLQFKLCQQKDCQPKYHQKFQQKCQLNKNCHQKRIWAVSLEAIQKQCWNKIKSVLSLQAKSTQYKIFWLSSNDIQFCSITVNWKLKLQQNSSANDSDGKLDLFTADQIILRR